MKNILFVASEGVPFIKTGGLADVVGSLPKGIDKEYYEKETIFWVLEGSLKVLYNEEDEIIVNEGEMVCLESDINYGVKALSTCKVCNILVKA